MSNYLQEQKDWIRNSGIKIGSSVKVVRAAMDMENGWGLCWNSEMYNYIGNIYKVKDIDYTYGLKLEECFVESYYYVFPYFILEPVEVSNKNYPHKCPNCNGPAFIGLSKVDCKNKCKG